jgi:hypothetical protein
VIFHSRQFLSRLKKNHGCQVRLEFPKDAGKAFKTVPAHYDHTTGVPRSGKIEGTSEVSLGEYPLVK